MELIFATHNQDKLMEVQKLLPDHITLLSLKDLSYHEEIMETGKTIEENAKIKARHIVEKFGLPCFADDTGLMVNALGGRPGVLSARYAGPKKNAEDNINKLLLELEGQDDRSAFFKTIIAMNLNGKDLCFKGIVKGAITKERLGEKGFGYDPIFKPDGFEKTFAQLPISTKNKIGHRGKAIGHMIAYIQGNTAKPPKS